MKWSLSEYQRGQTDQNRCLSSDVDEESFLLNAIFKQIPIDDESLTRDRFIYYK